MAARLTAITIYPVKSTAGLAVGDAAVERRGLAHDRRLLVVDETGRFLTARKYPRLLLVRATPTAAGVRLTAPALDPLDVAITPNEGMEVEVWRDTVRAALVSAAADAWLGRHLGTACRLVSMTAASARPASPDHGEAGDEVSFADAMPILVISQAALDGLNARLEATGGGAVPMARFRPNLVIGGCAPHAEDEWRRIRIGEVELDLVKFCDRCVLTTIDPETAVADPAQEPLRTLATYRRMDGRVMFGQNAIPRRLGRLQVGDPVTVVSRR